MADELAAQLADLSVATTPASRPTTPPPLSTPPLLLDPPTDDDDDVESTSIDRFVAFGDVWNRWTSLNDSQREMRDAVTRFVGNDSPNAKVLRIECPRRCGKSTLATHAAAAHLAAEPLETVVLITPRWEIAALHDDVAALLFEQYLDGYSRLDMSAHETPAMRTAVRHVPDGSETVVPSTTVRHEGHVECTFDGRHLLLTDDASSIPYPVALVLVDCAGGNDIHGELAAYKCKRVVVVTSPYATFRTVHIA
jgi:hypothetical protein